MWSNVVFLLVIHGYSLHAAKPVIITESLTIFCPDGRLECIGPSTCCALAGGFYGCCPFPNATCCADKLHCCPPGTTCDLIQGQCLKAIDSNAVGSTIWEDLSHASVRREILSNTTLQRSSHFSDNQVCPGGSKTCPDSYTCCALPEEGYGCCPIRNAVCCSDRIHCCPPGSECNVAGGGCKKKSVASSGNNVRCQDGSQCPDGTTCCLSLSGGYGCCPLKDAICCDDKQHCCPHGYKCLSTGYCTKVAKPYDLLFLRAFAKSKVIAKKIA